MSKRQIIILVVVGILIFIATFVGVFILVTNDDNKLIMPSSSSTEVIKLKDYTLHTGQYIGTEKEYNPNTEELTERTVSLFLSKDSISTDNEYGFQEFFIQDNSLYVKNGSKSVELCKVTADDEFTLLAGAGTNYKYFILYEEK